MTDYGHVIGGAPEVDYYSSPLEADLTVGDTVLQVSDTGVFDEDATSNAGLLMIGLELDSNGQLDPSTATLVPYATCDEDAGTVTLLGASPVPAAAGDLVYVYDPVTGLPVLDVTVWAAADGADPAGDALPISLTGTMARDMLDVDLDGQAIAWDEDEDGELIATDLPGMSPVSGKVRGYQDSTAATGPGEVVVPLTYKPIPDSTIHVYWGGLFQTDDQWTYDSDDQSVTLHDGDAVIRSGQVVMAKYLYDDPATRRVPHPDLVIDLPAWQAEDDWHSGLVTDALVDPATGGLEEIVMEGSSFALGIGYFAAEEHLGGGFPDLVYLPTVPDGYVLSHATYVVRAYRESVTIPSGDWSSGFTPVPTAFPALAADSSATSDDFYVFDDLPVGAYDGEQVWPGSEVLTYLTAAPGAQKPANRLWVEDPGTPPFVHVAYYALRLTYSWAG